MALAIQAKFKIWNSHRHMVYKLVWGPRCDRTLCVHKRLGCLNDIFAVVLLVLYLRLMAFDYKMFIRCYKEVSLKTYGSKRKGCFQNSNGQKEMTLKSFFYEKEEDKNNGEKNIVYVQCRIQFIRNFLKSIKLLFQNMTSLIKNY